MTRYVATGAQAAGGIGKILFCDDTNLDRRVVVKFISDGAEHRRHLDELAALQSIRSKHVVEVFDVAYFAPGPRMGIVEEHVDGVELSDRVGRVAPDQTFARLLYQMSSGLADIHGAGLIHRDIKPANMMIDGHGILKIIDFNLARHVVNGQTRGVVGTRGYLAPELYHEDGAGNVTFDEKVDVYALGITCIALLVGALPATLASRPPHPQQWLTGGGFAALLPTLDKQLVGLLDACLSEDPRRRPSADQVRRRAERVLLRGRHRAWFVADRGATFLLSKAKPRVKLEHPDGAGAVSIVYDDLDFKVMTTSGSVHVNNMDLGVGALLPGSCVISLGIGRNRVHITMDVSHPEVVL